MKIKPLIMLDQTTNRLSITLTFCYSLFFPALISSCRMAYDPTQDYFLGWACTNASFLISFVFYRIRRMDSFQASVAGASIGINAGAPDVKETKGESSVEPIVKF